MILGLSIWIAKKSLF